MAKRNRPSNAYRDRAPDKAPSALLVLLQPAREHVLLRKVHGARFAREVQNNSLPHDLRPRSASRSLWSTLMIPCAGTLFPPPPSRALTRGSCGSKPKWEKRGRIGEEEGTAMMTLSHRRTRKKLFAARKITDDRADKPRSLIEILIFYDGCNGLLW